MQELEKRRKETEVNTIKQNTMGNSRGSRHFGNYTNNRSTNSTNGKQGGKYQAANYYRQSARDGDSRYTTRRGASERADTRTRTTPNQNSWLTADECGRCGHVHFIKEYCPAKGKVCKICNKLNHFARMCFISKQKVNVREKEVENKTET